MTSPELFALSQGRRCEGPHRCHWCGSPCERGDAADDPVYPFVRRAVYAMHPSEPWQCVGCGLYKRRSVTALFLDGSFKDRQCPEDHSWLVTRDGAHALDLESRETLDLLRDFLTRPPHEFLLSLRAGPLKNYIHMAHVNVVAEIKADTPLTYTVDGTRFSYTIHQLEKALRNPDECSGLDGGSSELLRRFGPLPSEPKREEPRRGRGRPPGRVADKGGLPEFQERARQQKPLRMSGLGLVA
jgi:hypothetical protein